LAEPLQLAAAAEPNGHAAASAAPPYGDALAFYATLAKLIPLPANVRTVASAYRDQTYLHVGEFGDVINFLTELVALPSSERGRPH
jgi:hypothetical protein